MNDGEGSEKPGRGPLDPARRRAAYAHQGPNSWHVERTREAIVCGQCKARIPHWMKPTFCPECGAGR